MVREELQREPPGYNTVSTKFPVQWTAWHFAKLNVKYCAWKSDLANSHMYFPVVDDFHLKQDADIFCFDLKHWGSKYKAKFRVSESQTGKYILSFQPVLFSIECSAREASQQSVHWVWHPNKIQFLPFTKHRFFQYLFTSVIRQKFLDADILWTRG